MDAGAEVSYVDIVVRDVGIIFEIEDMQQPQTFHFEVSGEKI